MSRRGRQQRTVIALAGRRVDAPDTSAHRFPYENISQVRAALREVFQRQNAATLVCSAACGADLVALDVAGEMNIERHIILPYSEARFRADSVVDRPGDWGELFDRICAEVKQQGHLLVMDMNIANQVGWTRANEVIVEHAHRLAEKANTDSGRRSHRAIGVVVWNEVPWGDEDVTAAFVREVKRWGIPLITVSTVEPQGAHTSI